MSGIIDVHTHILPGMDDGSKTPEESLAMLQEEVRQNVAHVVFTPHFYAHQNSPAEFLVRREEAWQRLKPLLTPGLPELFFGAEVQYFEGICMVPDLDSLRIQGTNYLLLEMPFQSWSSRAVQDALELNARPDFQVILAHIERYFKFAPKDAWEIFRENGLMTQCNASFFIDWRTRRKAMSMLKHGEIDLLGSDCHNLTSRAPNMAKAYPFIRKCLG